MIPLEPEDVSAAERAEGQREPGLRDFRFCIARFIRVLGCLGCLGGLGGLGV